MSNKYSIYTRSGSNMLYLNIFGKRMSTGIPDSPTGRKLVKQQAEKLLVERLENAGVIEPTHKTGIKDIGDKYLEHLAKKNKSHKTIYGIRNALQHLNYGLNYELTSLNMDRQILKLLEKNNLQAITKNNILKRLTTMLRWAKRFRHISEDIDVSQFFERTRTNERPSYSAAEVAILLEKANQHDREFYLLLLFITLTGFRIAETLELKLSDFYLEQGYIEVPNKIQKTFLQKFPITGAVRAVYDELLAMSQKRKKNQLKLFRWDGPSWIREKFIEIEKDSNFKVKGRGFHGLRRSFSNELFDNELPLEVIKELMRHSDIGMTMQHYKSYKAQRLGSQLETIHCAKTVQELIP